MDYISIVLFGAKRLARRKLKSQTIILLTLLYIRSFFSLLCIMRVGGAWIVRYCRLPVRLQSREGYLLRW